MRGSSWEKRGADPLENSNLINSQSQISENRPQTSPGKQTNLPQLQKNLDPRIHITTDDKKQ